MENNSNKSLNILAVAGGGCDPDRSSVVYRMIKSHAEDIKVNYYPISGCLEFDDDYVVQTPSDQLYKISETVEHIKSVENDARFLLIAQCLGSTATMNFLADTSHDMSIRAVVFSPATVPGDVLQTDSSRARRRENNTRLRVNHLAGSTRDYELNVEKAFTAKIPEDYFNQHEASGDLTSEMVRQVKLGRLAMFATQHDWNQTSVSDIDRIKAEMDKDCFSDRIEILQEAGHSLHVPNSMSSDNEYRLKTQYEKAVYVVESGISLFNSSE